MGTRGTAHVLNQTLNEDLREDWTCYYYYIIYIYIYNAGDPWFESRSWYDRFLYVNIHLFILMPVSCNSSILLKILNSDTVEHL